MVHLIYHHSEQENRAHDGEVKRAGDLTVDEILEDFQQGGADNS